MQDDTPATPEPIPHWFVGRTLALRRIQQHITDTQKTSAPAFIGRRGIGKTALLSQFSGVQYPGVVGVHIPLRVIQPADERAWITALIQRTEQTLAETDFYLGEIEHPHELDVDVLRQWYADNLLPAVVRSLRRRHYRLLLLIDDADQLLTTAEGDALSNDYFAYLDDLINPYVGVAVALDITYEDDLEPFYPLVDPTNVVRLNSLTVDDCSELLTLAAAMTSDAETGTKLHRATGGDPPLVQAYAQALAPLKPIDNISAAIKKTTETVYNQTTDHMRSIWSQLDQNERLVLTAVASILYDFPNRPINTDRIESWLVETDYPLDRTAINAAIRSLEYRELVSGSPSTSVVLSSSLMQKWLLEHARLDDTNSTAMPSNEPNRLLLMAALAIVGIMLLVVLVLATTNGETGSSDATPIPTVELESIGSGDGN